MSNDYYNPEIIRTHYIAFKEFLESQDNGKYNIII